MSSDLLEQVHGAAVGVADGGAVDRHPHHLARRVVSARGAAVACCRGHPVHAQRRRAHRLPGDGPRTGAAVRAHLGVADGAAGLRAEHGRVHRAAVLVRPPDHVRPARVGALRPGGRGADAGGADRRHPGRDGRGGLRAHGARGLAGGRPAGHHLRRQPSRARQLADPVRHVRAHALGGGLRLPPARPRARHAPGRRDRPVGPGRDPAGAGPQPRRRPGVRRLGGPDGALLGQPRDDPQDVRHHRGDRRAPRAAHAVGAHPGHAPARRRVPDGRALALPGRAHPGRPVRGAGGPRLAVLGGRQRGHPRRDRGGADRHRATPPSPTGSWPP